MRITAIANQKGGVGKSTTAHALFTGLNQRGHKALLIDADPQGNASSTTQADPRRANLYDAMRGVVPVTDAIQHTDQGDIIASNLNLSGADMEFTQTGREYIMREMLEGIPADAYTHVIIDCPPALGIMSINALTASNDIIIPIGADIYSIQGLGQLMNTIDKVRRYSNSGLSIAGLLITRKGTRATATAQLIEAIQSTAVAQRLHLYGVTIREGIAIKEAQISRISIFEAAPKAKVTADYNAFIDEYLIQE